MDRRLAMIALVAAFASSGCLGTETGNPPFTAGLVARSTSLDVGLPSDPASITVESAWLSVADVRSILGDACDHVSDPHDADVVGDVVDGVSLAGLPDEPTCGLHVTFAVRDAPVEGAPDGLLGRAIFITGQRADGAPFELSSDHAMAIDVAATAPFSLDPMSGGVVMAFDVAAWLAALDLSSVPLDADGVARIGPIDPAVSDLEAGFAASVALFEDLDGDGVLDAAEESRGPLAVSHP